MNSTTIYIVLALIVAAFGAGMYTESRFHLAGEVSKQNAQIVATREGQIDSEVLAADGHTRKDQIADIKPIEENDHEKSDCTVPAGIFDQLQRTAETANRAARGSD